MNDIKIPQGTHITIELPALTAIRIDTATRTIVVDNISGHPCKEERWLPAWRLLDLRDGTYGDFHRLKRPEECVDADCVASGEHLVVEKQQR